uniref:Uncharacterized protein n=1 Tax=Rangifer tarandus platyrhynchus TaxID=3082113 RepID=A0ACB0ECG5_RANTA|nr:unnamed protein product [Rangifer tarandus platyrhynchus]
MLGRASRIGVCRLWPQPPGPSVRGPLQPRTRSGRRALLPRLAARASQAASLAERPRPSRHVSRHASQNCPRRDGNTPALELKMSCASNKKGATGQATRRPVSGRSQSSLLSLRVAPSLCL